MHKKLHNGVLRTYKLGYIDVIRNIEHLYDLGIPETVKVIKDYTYDRDKHAQTKIGLVYMKSLKVKKGYDEALKWLQKSSKQNDEFGLYLLAAIYYNGFGIKQDYIKAAHFIVRAVSLLLLIYTHYEDTYVS